MAPLQGLYIVHLPGDLGEQGEVLQQVIKVSLHYFSRVVS